MRAVFIQVAAVLRPVFLDGPFDLAALVQVIAARDAEPQAVERRHFVFLLQRCDRGVAACHPGLPHGFHPFRQDDLDVRPLLGHVAVLGRVDEADEEVGRFGG